MMLELLVYSIKVIVLKSLHIEGVDSRETSKVGVDGECGGVELDVWVED